MSADFPDEWVAGMVQEGARRADDAIAKRLDLVLTLIPEQFHAVVRTLTGAAVAQGQMSAFEVLHEQGWFKDELGRAS